MPDSSALVRSIGELIAGRQLVVVSNREPYVHTRIEEEIAVQRPVGGLVAALDPVMQTTSGIWVAWGSGDADFDVTDEHGRVQVPPDAPRYTLRRIPLSRSEVSGYYYGYANQALWPLCHMAMQHARFPRRFWELYEQANLRFARTVLEEADAHALIWIHDYHLALCPRYLHRARPDLFIMQFWHIPWPAWDVFRICPQSALLIDGLLGNDLLGFQHARHVEHFLECAEREVGAHVNREDGTVEYQGRLTHVATFPISVDFAALDRTARLEECERWMQQLSERYGLAGRYLAVGVDRLDYTKGIPERVRALDVLFERFPQYQSRLVFVQKSAPSRTSIPAYRNLQSRVEQEIEHLNARYGAPGWRPVLYLPEPLPPEGMAALYRMADLCIVSSLADGMNLVAKEFVACQVDLRGALVLSEFAGARDELPWAIPINPHDPESFADAVHQALEMPAEERRTRMIHLRTYVAEHDIYAWVRQHLEAAVRLLATRTPTRLLFDHVDAVRRRLEEGHTLALLLDFDGTLAAIADEPDLVQLPSDVRAVLERIVDVPGAMVAVVSGRAVEDVRQRLGIDRLTYAGNHGLEVSGPGWEWTLEEAVPARDAIAECCRRLRRRLRHVPGAIVEEKGLSASVHYRLTPHPRVEEVRIAVFEEVGRLAPRSVVVRQGKMVLELRPAVAWDKGAAVQWLLRRTYGHDWAASACAIYIGDDRTDEDVFRVMPDPAFTVKVGEAPYTTAARYMVRDVNEVRQFLDLLAAWLDTQRVTRDP